jgi:hypothetical protein
MRFVAVFVYGNVTHELVSRVSILYILIFVSLMYISKIINVKWSNAPYAICTDFSITAQTTMINILRMVFSLLYNVALSKTSKDRNRDQHINGLMGNKRSQLSRKYTDHIY